MSEEIIKILDNLCGKFGIAIDWTSKNIKPYLQELFKRYINYEVATSVMWLIVAGIGIFGCIFIFRTIKNKKFSKDEYDNKAMKFLAYFGITILTFMLFYVVIEQIIDIITCYSFPEKLVIDLLNTYQ